MMHLRILGTGTSMGVPVIGCSCAVCTSDDPRNRRLRTSALVETAETTVLIDAGPDMREQVLRHNVDRLDAVLLTHSHADHIGGIDDLRPFTRHLPNGLPLYGNRVTLDRVRHQFDYAFDPAPSLSTRPQLEASELNGPFQVGTLPIIPFTVYHGPHAIMGYRFGRLGYITDGKTLPDATLEALTGLDTLVINALRYEDHPLHFTVDEALAIIKQLAPRQARLVHITHDLEHATVNATLPNNVRLAYDGELIEIPDA